MTPAPLRLRVIPNAKRSEVVGEYGEAIKIKIAAPALEGKANEAVREFLGKTLGVSTRAIALIAGEKSRDKVVAINGLDLETVRARLLGASVADPAKASRASRRAATAL